MSMTLNTKLKHMAIVLFGSCAVGVFVGLKVLDGWPWFLAWPAALAAAIATRYVLISFWPVRDSAARR